MASYRIIWKNSAEKDLKGIDRQHIPRILEVTESLGDDPFPFQYRKLIGGEGSYRVRVGDYRIIYQVDVEGKVVEIFHVHHRKDVYR